MRPDRADPGCDAARRRLWPRDVPRRYTSEEEPARRHLEACDDCRAFFRRDHAVGRAVARFGAAAGASSELRERVYHALARERALRPSTGTSGPSARGPRGALPASGAGRLAAAALLATALLAGSVLLTGRPASAGAYVDDFVSRAVEEDVIVTSDPVAVSRFFMKEMGVGVAAVELERAELSQAMICLIRGERAAMVEYRWRGHTVAHYRLPLPGLPGSRKAREPAAGPRLHAAVERGVQVIRWEDGQFEHAVVSELPLRELLELVRSGFLAGG